MRRARPAPPAAPLAIRRAAPGDATAIARVMRAAVRGVETPLYTPAQVVAWSRLPPLYHRWAMTEGDETYVVATRGGRLVGYAALRRDELTAAFVRPDAGGAGVGAALVRRVEALARRRGVRRLRVLAAAAAVPFYAALGFTKGRATVTPLPGAPGLPSRRMSKRLARTTR